MTRIQKKKPSHLAISASKKNAGVADQFMSSSDSATLVAARVEANLGSYFRLVAHNGTCCIQIIGSPRGLFKQRRANIRLAVNDIVLVSGIAAGPCEIVCRLEKADAHSLHKDGKIHTLVYRSASALETVEEDDIFELADGESPGATTYGESPGATTYGESPGATTCGESPGATTCGESPGATTSDTSPEVNVDSI